MYSKVIQLYIYIYLFFFNFFSHLGYYGLHIFKFYLFIFGCVGSSLLRGMWDLPGAALEPMSPALASRFLTTAPPGKPYYGILSRVPRGLVGSCWLSILYIVVYFFKLINFYWSILALHCCVRVLCVCQSQAPNLSHTPGLPFGNLKFVFEICESVSVL